MTSGKNWKKNIKDLLESLKVFIIGQDLRISLLESSKNYFLSSMIISKRKYYRDSAVIL